MRNVNSQRKQTIVKYKGLSEYVNIHDLEFGETH